jgi:phage gp46-like protein
MDIGLSLSADGSFSDLSIVNGDLALDGTLMTAVLLSLQCDRLADPDDIIPDGTGNRRGWCGDAFLPPLADGSPDYLGSKLWLFARCTATQQNANLIAEAASQALAWMIADGVAQSVNVTTAWVNAESLALTIEIAQFISAGAVQSSPFTLLWNRTLGTITSMPVLGSA